MSGSIVVHTSSIWFNLLNPSRTEISETIEGYAFDKLEELDVDMSDAKVTKFVNEGDLMFTEIKVHGVKYVVRLLEKDTVPGSGEAVWLVQIEQH